MAQSDLTKLSVHATRIIWDTENSDTDGDSAELPESVDVINIDVTDANDDDQILDAVLDKLTDEHGFLISHVDYEVLPDVFTDEEADIA